MLAQQLKEFDITYNPKDSILEKILKEGKVAHCSPFRAY
jgi:hypothetical protein